MLTPPRRISLPTTSFFGTTAQGIHCRLVALRRTKDISPPTGGLIPVPSTKNGHDKKASFPLTRQLPLPRRLRGNSLIYQFCTTGISPGNVQKSFGSHVKEQLALLSRRCLPYIMVGSSDTRAYCGPGRSRTACLFIANEAFNQVNFGPFPTQGDPKANLSSSLR